MDDNKNIHVADSLVQDFAGHAVLATGYLGMACSPMLALSYSDLQNIVLHVLLLPTTDVPIGHRDGFLGANIWKARAAAICTK
jgi:hypothetical protein